MSRTSDDVISPVVLFMLMCTLCNVQTFSTSRYLLVFFFASMSTCSLVLTCTHDLLFLHFQHTVRLLGLHSFISPDYFSLLSPRLGHLLSISRATVHSCTCCCEIVRGFMGNGFDERKCRQCC